jgi:hypothetical protein
MEWSNSLEQLLAKYCDESQVRGALHRKAYYFYKKLSSCFQLPIIIGSALSGSLQFLSKSFPAVEDHIVTCTASLSIIVSLLSAVMSYLKIGEQQTKNELALVEWQNFHDNVQHQLALRRQDRLDPEEFIEWVKQQQKRLFEISPVCNQKFIAQTKKKIRKVATEEFKVPFYLNGYEHAKIWKEPNDDEKEEDEVFEDNESSEEPII